jgi:hypothetical protein
MSDPIRMHVVAPTLPLSQEGRGKPALYALMLEASACRDRSDFKRAIWLGGQMLALAEASQDRQSTMLAHYILGTTGVALSDFIQVRTNLETGLSLYCDAEDGQLVAFTGADVKVMLLMWLSVILWGIGYPVQAASRDWQAICLAYQLAQPSTLTAALSASVWLALFGRTGDDPSPKIETLQRVVDERGLEIARPWATVYGGWLLVRQGRVMEGIEIMRKCIAAWGQGWGGPGLAVVLAQTCLQAELYDQGLSAVDEALALVEQGLRGHYFDPELYRLRGALILGKAEPGGAEAAAESFLRAIEGARSQQLHSWELRAAVSLARLWRRQGKVSEAQHLLAGIYGWFSEGFDTPDLQEARALLAELASESGNCSACA